MFVRTLAAAAVLWLGACDAQTPSPAEPVAPVGIFTGLFNGEPFEAPATFRAENGGILAEAFVIDPATYHTVGVSLTYARDSWTHGEYPLTVRDSSGVDARYGALVGEVQGDVAVQLYRPVPGEPGSFVVDLADAETGRYSARFSGTFAAIDTRHPYQTLADTIRVTDGRFQIGDGGDG